MHFDGDAACRSPSAILTPVKISVFVFAVLLTVLTAVLHWGFTPPAGFVRTFYPTGNFQSAPISDDRTTEVSLAFLGQNPSLPRRSFGVQWRGFWYFPEDRALELSVSSNDEVQLLVDSTTVIRRKPREKPETVKRSLTLTKGTHEIVIRYRQHGSGMGLAVLSSVSRTTPGPLPVTSIFAEPVERRGVAIAGVVPWLMAFTGIAWLATAGLVVAGHFVGPRPNRWRIALATPRVFASRLRLLAGPALLGPIVLFLVGPVTIHGANPQEFVVPFADIVWPWAVGAIVVSWTMLLVLSAMASLLSERLTRVCAAVLLAVGLLLWAQGTLLVADYGPLYGEALDLRAHADRVPYEAVLWGGVLGAAIVYARQVSRVASMLSLMFVGLQVGAVAVALANPMQARGHAQSGGWSAPPSRLYTLSRSENVIHIVLDGFMSELFGEAVTQERAFFDRRFSGFVYFAEHLGAFPTTRASMPAMLTGEAYRNEEPFERFRGRTQQRSIATVLAEHGYEVRSITFHRIEHPEITSAPKPVVRYTIPTPYGSYEDYVRFTALQLFDFAAFRHVPQALKASVYNDDAWLWQRALSAGTLESQRSRLVRPSNHAAFLTEMSGRLTAGVDSPVYQFIHVAVPHPPVVLDADCSVVQRGRTSRRTYEEQSRCGIAMVGKLLDRLRALGVYDQSIVVLTSDHGWRVPRPNHPLAGVSTPAGDLQSVALTAMPLLAVKPKRASGPLRISKAPTAITDIPATIADLAGLPPGLFPGQPAFRLEPDARRSRSFAFHSWRNADWSREYMDALHVFSVDGPIHEPGSWRFRQTIVDPAGAP